MYFHPDFPFYFSSAISMLQPQAEHHLTKGGLRGTHDESGYLDHNFHHNQDLHILALLFLKFKFLFASLFNTQHDVVP